MTPETTMTFRNRLAALAALACALSPSAFAQVVGGEPPAEEEVSAQAPERARRFELTAIAGYQVNTDVDADQGTLRVDDAPVYGAAFGVAPAPNYQVEVLWLYSEPTVRASGLYVNGSAPFDVATHYFQVGGIRSVRRQAVELFGGGTLGAALFLPGTLRLADGSTVGLGDTWRFAFTFGGGVKIRVVPKVALRLETRLALPLYFSSGGVYVGSGGAGLGVSGGVPIWQWNFLGGLAFSP